MDNEVFEYIIDEYEKQRAKNERERDMRIKRVYESVPEIHDIDIKISEIGSNTLRAILSNPDKTDVKEDMKEKFRILTQRKKELLEKNNIPQDYDKLKYKCSLCCDTGYIEGQGRCSCFKQKLINKLYKQSNMEELIKKQNFSCFDDSYYSKQSVGNLKKSPYENIIELKKVCFNFIRDFEKPGKSLVFYGDTGLGKTFMSSCIAKELLDRGKTVIYIRATKLFKMFEDERFGRLEEGFDEIYKADLLIIDDLGTEAISKNNNSYILNLINERIDSDKKIIINTNLNYDGLEKVYTKRFSSRLLDNFKMLYFYGKDIRQQKLFKRQ